MGTSACRGRRWQPKVAVMPMHPVTSTLMYRGICTIPDMLYSQPVNLPEDEVEGEMMIVMMKMRMRRRMVPARGHLSVFTDQHRIWFSVCGCGGAGSAPWTAHRDVFYIGLWFLIDFHPLISPNHQPLCYLCYSKIR